MESGLNDCLMLDEAYDGHPKEECKLWDIERDIIRLRQLSKNHPSRMELKKWADEILD